MKTTVLTINSKNMVVCDEPECKDCVTRFTCKGKKECKRDYDGVMSSGITDGRIIQDLSEGKRIAFCLTCKHSSTTGLLDDDEMICSKRDKIVYVDDVCKKHEFK